MFHSEIAQLSGAAQAKYRKASERTGQYFVAAAFAGFFIFVATILSHVMAAILTDVHWALAKVMGAFLFSIAIILIVFIGGELFTGNNMTMAFGMYTGKVTLRQSLKVWFYSYVGNLIGLLLMCLLFYFSGAQRDVLTEYYAATIPGKLEISALEMLIRGVLCNFLVCLAVFTGSRLKSECGKMFIMICVISSFVIAGFEHSIANMSTYALAWMFLGGLPAGMVAKSMLMVTLGNMIGGILLFAAPVYYLSKDGLKGEGPGAGQS